MRGVDWLAAVMRSMFGFGPKRDLAAALGYLPILHYHDYLQRYGRGDIAGRIVEIPPEATWDTLPRLTGDRELESETGLSRKFQRLAERVQLRRMLEKADVLAGIGRYSVLLIGLADGKPLHEPVEAGSVRADGVLYVQPFSEMSALPTELDLDPKSPGFGRPKIYQLDLAHGLLTDGVGVAEQLLRKSITTSFTDATSARVHVSRLVHIAEGTLEDDIFGRPRLRRVWDRLDDLSKTVGGSAETFWMVANRGIQFDVDKDVRLGETEKKALEQQMEDYVNGLSRIFRTKGVQIKGLNELGAGNVNPRQVFSVIAALIVGTTGIPYRMLFGTERGQNISEGDRKAWLEQIASRRKTFANEVVLRPFIDKLAHAGALPTAAREAEIVWPMIHDDMHRAQVADTVARAESNHAKAIAQGGAVLSTAEFRSIYLGLPPKRPDDPNEEPDTEDTTDADDAMPPETPERDDDREAA